MSDHAADAIVFPPTKPASSLSRWQFSLKSVLALMAIVCLIFSTVVAPVIPAVLLAICWPICAIGLLTAAIGGRGWIRPFAIAALIPMLWFAFAILAWPLHHPGEAAVVLAIMYAVSIVVGLTASVMSSYLARRSGLVPVPNIPFIRKWLSN